jgi:membrane protease YdiL (CAAX protease family)
MSLKRRILLFPLSRLVIALVVLLVPLVLIDGLLGSVLVKAPLLAGAIEVLLALAAFASVGVWIERKTIPALGFPLRPLVRDLGWGFVGGAALMSAVIGVLALAGWYQVSGAGDLAHAPGLLLEALLFYLLVAVFEEVLFRGILFRIVEEWLGSWAAIVISALIFGLAHLANPNATLVSALAIALEAGVLLALVYMLTRSLWAVIGIHWAFNFFEGPLFGAQISGVQGTGVLKSTISGPALWTGGSFGPEAGLVTVLFCLAVSVALIIEVRRRGQVMTPDWLRRLLGQKTAQAVASS